MDYLKLTSMNRQSILKMEYYMYNDFNCVLIMVYTTTIIILSALLTCPLDLSISVLNSTDIVNIIICSGGSGPRHRQTRDIVTLNHK